MPQQPVKPGDDVTSLMNAPQPGDDVTHLMQPVTNINNPSIPEQSTGLLSRGWNFLNTSPITGRQATPMGEFARKLMDPATGMRTVQEEGLTQATTPLSIGAELLGGIGAFRGVSRLKGLFGGASKVTGEAAPEVSAASKEGDILGQQSLTGLLKEGIPETPALKIKPRVRVNLDGTFTNLDTGEVLNPKAGKELTPPQTIRPMFNPKSQTGMTGSMQPPVPPNNDNIPALLEGSNEPAKFVNPKQKQSAFQQIRNFQRTLLVSYDFSAPGRQGKGLLTHPEFYGALDDMFKSWGSREAAQVVNESIINHPSGFFKPSAAWAINKEGKLIPKSFAERAGLDLTDTAMNKEEAFRSQLAMKLPGVERSERAYVAFMNKIRSDVFAKLVTQAGAEDNLPVARQIANSVNISTGRGKTGLEDSERAMKVLNETFFAPKLISSRVQMYTRVLDPRTYTQADPVVRNEALRSLFGIAGTNLLIGEMARMAGAEVNNDPRSSDFRKIKIGNTRIDNMAGLQQYGVAATKLITGQMVPSGKDRPIDLTAGRYGQPTRQTIAEQFFANKLAPIPSFVWSWMSGKEFDGTPFNVKQALLQRTVPIVMQDLYQISQEHPNELPLPGKVLAGASAMMGEGVQTYGR